MKRALLRTLPGRAIVIGLTIKLAVFLLRAVAGQAPAFVGVFDTAGSLAVAAGGGYFLVRGMAFVRRRLLWRVRRKLIISYIFVGFVPAILIIAFFLLGGVLLFSNFSSYLVQNRFRVLGERAASIASTTVSEIQHAGGSDVAAILARRQAAIAGEFPGASFAVVPMNRPCASSGTAASSGVPSVAFDTAGPWSHVEPPASVPGWVTCGGFVGLLAYEREGERANGGSGAPVIVVQTPAASVSSNDVPSHALIRAIAFPESRVPGYGVVVDLLINEHVRQQLRQETGAELTDIRRVSRDVAPLRRRADYPDGPAAAGPNAFSLNQPSLTFLEYVDWTTGKRGGVLMVPMRLSIGEIYQRISSQGTGDRTFGQALFLVLVIIGVLFLVIEAAALVT